MGYPSLDTVRSFQDIVKRDGLEDITENLFTKNQDLRMSAILSYFKLILTQMLENELLDEANGFSNGFISCLDLFRRQINSEKANLEELNIQIENICGWVQFLENENLSLGNQVNELTRRNKELQEMLAVLQNGDVSGSAGMEGNA